MRTLVMAADDHPGEDLPRFRFAFEVTGDVERSRGGGDPEDALLLGAAGVDPEIVNAAEIVRHHEAEGGAPGVIVNPSLNCGLSGTGDCCVLR